MADSALTYRLETFEGPLDLLLTLIQKNKMQIEDIPISLICDQYMSYIAEAQKLDMELAVEFIQMASELMYIKSKMLLPRQAPEEDPRARLAEAVARLDAAKKAAVKLGELYGRFGGRMEKDTDEISVDRSYVAEGQDPERLYEAMRRVLTYANASKENIADKLVRPLVAKPIIPVGLKIIGIMKHFDGTHRRATLGQMLDDATSRADLIAIFLGVLELVRMRRILLVENEDDFTELDGVSTSFEINLDYDPAEGGETDDFDT